MRGLKVSNDGRRAFAERLVRIFHLCLRSPDVVHPWDLVSIFPCSPSGSPGNPFYLRVLIRVEERPPRSRAHLLPPFLFDYTSPVNDQTTRPGPSFPRRKSFRCLTEVENIDKLRVKLLRSFEVSKSCIYNCRITDWRDSRRDFVELEIGTRCFSSVRVHCQ